MSLSLRSLLPVARLGLRATPRLPCSCRPAFALALSAQSQPFLSRSYAAKKSKGKRGAAVVEEEEEVAQPKGKGVKKGKGKFVEEEEVAEEGVTFDLKALEKSMEDAVDRLRVGLKTVVGRVGRVSPDLLDSIKIEVEGKRHPLAEFATVSVKDGKDLVVTVYEESSLKAVSHAIYASPLSLAPQHISATTLRVPIPRPDWDKRQALVKQASELCEHARVAVRAARGKGQKEIKADVDGKAIGKDEGRSEVKKLDTSTKKRTDEVDSIFEKAKKVLMDE